MAEVNLSAIFAHKTLAPTYKLDRTALSRVVGRDLFLVEAALLGPADPDIAAAAALIDKLEATCDAGELQARRAVASMVGMAVGDAIGAPVEFKPLDYKFRGVKDMGSGAQGAFELQPGQWTDDTSMGLCLADSLLSTGGTLCPLDLRLRFAAWWHSGYNNAFARDRTRDMGRGGRASVGLGGNISMSLREFENTGNPYTTAGNCETSGNGSIMRLAPAAIAHIDDIAVAMETAQLQSRTTHQGSGAHECSRLLAGLIVRLVETGDRGVLENISSFFDTTDASVRAIAQSVADPVDLLTTWNWKAKPFYYNKQRSLQQPGYIGSFSLDALAMSLHCVFHTTSFCEAVLKVVNLCGDADSVGSVTAQIAGALYGFHATNGIPRDWLDTVQAWDGGTIAARAFKLFHHRWLPSTTCDHAPVPALPIGVKFHHTDGCGCVVHAAHAGASTGSGE